MKGLHYALISSIASIGSATFGSFGLGEPNIVATLACILVFGFSFGKYLDMNKYIEE